MKHFNKNRGFTLVEIMLALTLVTLASVLLMGVVNYSDRTARNNASQITTAFAAIESAVNRYWNDKNGVYPTGLTDSTFVPTYLFIPALPASFDATYGTNGFYFGQQTGQASPNNGYYVCARANVTGASDPNWLTAGFIGNYLSAQKYFYNTSCPATSNMGAPAGATTVLYTMWLTRS